jgi:hypothetical protein
VVDVACLAILALKGRFHEVASVRRAPFHLTIGLLVTQKVKGDLRRAAVCADLADKIEPRLTLSDGQAIIVGQIFARKADRIALGVRDQTGFGDPAVAPAKQQGKGGDK